jgi:class 3 adenylate cyclase
MTLAGYSRRLGNVTQWPAADKVVLAALLVLPLMIVYAAVGLYLSQHPEIAPYWDRDFVVRVPLWIHTRVAIPSWLALLAIALALRRKDPHNLVIVHVAAQLYFVWFGLCAYFFGSHTTLYTSLTVIGGAAYSSVLFGTRVALGGVVSFILVISATSALEQLGLIPYAPMLLEPPIANRHLAASWLVGVGAVDFVALLVVLWLIFYLVGQWRSHQLKLAQTSDQLTRANDVISRYVASQLAEQILAGRYELLERHERRRLTLFFSDIKEFSEIAEAVEPEDLSATLNEYLSEMTSIAERHGATIDKFVGDAIMIFFGAPDHVDDREAAVRAVSMAIEMQARLVALREKWLAAGFERPLEVRMGINTGQASVGNFGSKGRMDYTAIGRQVNLAARLQASCSPGKILISHATWALVRSDIDAEPKGEIPIKGFHAPVRVYEVVGHKQQAD